MSSFPALSVESEGFFVLGSVEERTCPKFPRVRVAERRFVALCSAWSKPGRKSRIASSGTLVIRSCILLGLVCLGALPRLGAEGSARLPSKDQDTVSTQRQSG